MLPTDFRRGRRLRLDDHIVTWPKPYRLLMMPRRVNLRQPFDGVHIKASGTKAPSWSSRSGRGIGAIDFRHNLLPDFQISEFSRQTLDLGAVHAVTGDAQDSCNVSQMPVTPTFGEIPEFADDHIFRGRSHHIAIR
jgi:hypothetical protein